MLVVIIGKNYREVIEMSIKTTETLTREQALDKLIHSVNFDKYIYQLLNTFLSNNALEEILEKIDKDNDNPFTNYIVRED